MKEGAGMPLFNLSYTRALALPCNRISNPSMPTPEDIIHICSYSNIWSYSK